MPALQLNHQLISFGLVNSAVNIQIVAYFNQFSASGSETELILISDEFCPHHNVCTSYLLTLLQGNGANVQQERFSFQINTLAEGEKNVKNRTGTEILIALRLRLCSRLWRLC